MNFLFPIGILLILLGFSGGSWYPISSQFPCLIPAGRFLYIPGTLLVAVAVGQAIKRVGVVAGALGLISAATHPLPWSLGLLFLLLSDWPSRPFGFMPAEWFRGEVLVSGLLAWISIRFFGLRFFHVLAIASALVCMWCFSSAAQGRLLFSDDHAMFLFRLQLLKENFPFIPFWTPLWNGGIDARDFFATGALAPFLLSAPLIYLFDVSDIYNWVVGYLLWILTPLSSYFAARLFGSSRTTSSIAAVLSVCSSLFWYRWTLKYGTMGFTVATAFAPLVLALGWRFIHHERRSTFEIIASILAVSIMLLWTPSGLAVIPPLIVAGLPFALRIIRSKQNLITLIAIVVINAPLAFTLWKVSAVGKFLDTPKGSVQVVTANDSDSAPSIEKNEPSTANVGHQQNGVFRHKASGLNLKKSLKNWQEFAIAVNPLILICAIPGLFALPKQQRLLGFITSGWLLFLGTIAVPLLPQLELDRMLVILSIVVAHPVALFISKFFMEEVPDFASRFSCSISKYVFSAFLLSSLFASAHVVMNRSSEQYSFASPQVSELVDVIKREALGGRVLFTGCVLHQLSGGHLAPLPIWSGTPMAASSYAHNIWRYEQLVPASFMNRDDQGIIEYFDFMNATVVLAHEPYWRTYFTSHPDLYKEVWKGESFTAFKRVTYSANYSLSSDVSIEAATSNSVTFTTSSTSPVLKFKYFPFLTSSACSLVPHPVAPELELIKLENCPVNTPITIRSIPPLQRIFGSTKRS